MKVRSLTLMQMTAIALAAWLLLLAVFASGRVCEPFMSQTCVLQAWNFIGDVVWLRGLEDWQTLVGGILAIVAAFVGAALLNRQIRQAEEHERERRRRAMASARALMPLMLSRLTSYLEELSLDLRELRRACVGERLPREALRPDFPPVPGDVVASLQHMIETSDQATGAAFSSILSMLQLLDARARSLNARGDGPNREAVIVATNIETYVLNAVEIHAFASMLFPFARGETDDLPSAAMIAMQQSTSLHVLGFYDHEFPRMWETLATRIARQTPESPSAEVTTPAA